MLKGKKVLIGVTGGIAIYKVVSLISSLRKQDCDVEVIMTEASTNFINPITFETISNNTVYTDMWIHPDKVLHIDITKDKDLFLIAPATANTIAKVNVGIADNLLTASILASSAPVAFALSANTNMILNPITQNNINNLKKLNYDFIDSNEGRLACNTTGKGRMAEPDEILDYIDFKLNKKDLSGKKIIVTAGATISRIDPVRYLTNDSSGKMGYAIAKEARNRGAEVIFIQGKVKTKKLNFVKNINIETNKEMLNAIDENFEKADALIMAAAPVDYEILEENKEKIKKGRNNIDFKFKESIDILKYFASKKINQKLIGFAAETQNLIENAEKKLIGKNLDMIVANDVSKEGAGFNVDTNIATIITSKNKKALELMSKDELAKEIIDEMVKNVL